MQAAATAVLVAAIHHTQTPPPLLHHAPTAQMSGQQYITTPLPLPPHSMTRAATQLGTLATAAHQVAMQVGCAC